MSLEETIAANTAAIEKLTALLNGLEATQPVKAETTAPDTKVAKDAEAAKAAKVKASKPAPEPKAEPTAATYKEAAKALTDLNAAKGREEVMKLLNKYGAKKTLQEVKPEDFGNIISDVQAAL